MTHLKKCITRFLYLLIIVPLVFLTGFISFHLIFHPKQVEEKKSQLTVIKGEIRDRITKELIDTLNIRVHDASGSDFIFDTTISQKDDFCIELYTHSDDYLYNQIYSHQYNESEVRGIENGSINNVSASLHPLTFLRTSVKSRKGRLETKKIDLKITSLFDSTELTFDSTEFKIIDYYRNPDIPHAGSCDSTKFTKDYFYSDTLIIDVYSIKASDTISVLWNLISKEDTLHFEKQYTTTSKDTIDISLTFE